MFPLLLLLLQMACASTARHDPKKLSHTQTECRAAYLLVMLLLLSPTVRQIDLNDTQCTGDLRIEVPARPLMPNGGNSSGTMQ